MATKRRYSDSVDYRDIEPKIRKLLDTHLVASEVTQVIEPINIFDELAFEEAISRQKGIASQADQISSLTKRTITEKMEEDPAFYRKFSELLKQAIDDYHAQRISEADYLSKAQEIRKAIVNHQDEEIPVAIAEDKNVVAYWGLIKPFLEVHIENTETLDKVSLDAALAITDIIGQNAIVDWANNEEIKKDMMNAIDDYLYDVICDPHHLELSPEKMDEIIESAIRLGIKRFA